MLSIQKLNIKLEESTPRTIIHSFSLNVNEGESVAIVGESGAGKSCILYSILGLLKKGFIVEGKIEFFGVDLLRLSEKNMRKICGRQIGHVSQNCLQSFDPFFRVGTQINELLKIYYPDKSLEQIKKRGCKILSDVDLNPPIEIYKKFPDELSGGMIQRLAIAFSLANKPRLLLADELTSALDKQSEEEIMKTILLEVKKKKMGFLWVTHDLSLAEKFADEVVVMKEGVTVEYGSTLELIKKPKMQYTKKLLASIPKGQRNAL